MTVPAQSYSILFSAFLSLTGATVPQGYAVTRIAGGTYAVATTANLALSISGTIDGVALELGNPGDNIQVQKDAEVSPGVVAWLGTGLVEPCVVDADGKVQRASVAVGTEIGTVTKDGGVKLTPSGAASGALGGDVTGPSTANTVVKLRGIPVSAVAPTTNQLLAFDGANWAPATLSLSLAGDVTGALGANTVTKLQGRDVSSAAPSTGNALVWDGSNWEPGAAGTTVTWGGDLAGSSDSSQTVVSLSTANATIPVPTSALAFGGVPATIGPIRLAANTGIYARNAGNTANTALIRTDAANTLFVGDAANVNNGAFHCANLFGISIGGVTNQLLIGATTATCALSTFDFNSADATFSTGSIRMGTNPATTGNIQLADGDCSIWARNAGNTANQPVLIGNGSLYFGDNVWPTTYLRGTDVRLEATAGGNALLLSGSSSYVDVASGATFSIKANGTTLASFSASKIALLVATAAWSSTPSPVLTQDAPATDAATHNMTIQSQAPFASATGTNRNSGDIYLQTPAPVAGGVQGSIGLSGLNLAIGASAPNYQGGAKVVFIGDRTTAPTGNPTSGGYLYTEAGALKFRGSAGSITTLAAA